MISVLVGIRYQNESLYVSVDSTTPDLKEKEIVIRQWDSGTA
jgi:hypothetical protein